MIDNFLNFFEKIKSLKTGYFVFVLNQKNVKPILIGFESAKNISLDVFSDFSKKEVSSLEALFFSFQKHYNLKVRKLTSLPEEWQQIVKTFADEKAEFKVFEIEDLK